MLEEFEELWREADVLWDQQQNAASFGGYVSADYRVVYDQLVKYRGTLDTVLEWGSGLGVVTIMASRLGFDAYGIEAEQELVDYSRDFAARFAPDAQFAVGNFIPDEFDSVAERGDEFQQTRDDLCSAYEQFDMELRDFDLVYAYPWPDEYTMFLNIMRTFGRPRSLFMSFDVREGLKVERV